MIITTIIQILVVVVEKNNYDISENNNNDIINNQEQNLDGMNITNSNKTQDVKNFDSFSLFQIVRILYALVNCDISDINLNNLFIDKIAQNEGNVEIDLLNNQEICCARAVFDFCA
eukprot:TRINITY_DN25239_c0_g1_i1.p4 TRINITY_DN25239_c0_g1~~TRINITY_DN25239_c0_g1_i1.p4  ORF type:complete len:116 (-),score=8.69 TRINITY_DN25239_c0_g1_i1:13-360(-)